ncbi:hypothetical protein [Dysgonomonas gadei]|uniref:Uncharacterized protein n=1 Tax=Dysgonomonas gadei ATCC BAA-286 TaxID=742766 RepID=F5J3Y9_9BACT|nr:hypothetical protein [Dysgonomonas gadei]EGJ99560.1 hypothetical protein HMPREF9455_04056 [Dysgonomonas gadei ATCC BAA-286]
MREKIYFIFVFILFSFSLWGQNSLIEDKKSQTYLQDRYNNEIYVNKRIVKNDFIIEICNNTSDTIYLFDSYLTPELIKSKYIHRYNADVEKCKLSTLPLIPYLSVKLSDVIILGKDKIVKRYKTLYSFTPINPHCEIKLVIPLDVLNNNYKILDFEVKDKGSFDEIFFESINIDQKCSNIIIELAIYQKIDLLVSKEAYYLDSEKFEEQAKSFDVLAINFH